MKKGVIPERAITVGYNGPTKRNVTLEGIMKDTKLFVTKVLLKEKKERMGYHNDKSVHGLK